MAFSIDDRHADKSEKVMAEPRYMIVANQSIKMFAAIIEGRAQGKRKALTELAEAKIITDLAINY